MSLDNNTGHRVATTCLSITQHGVQPRSRLIKLSDSYTEFSGASVMDYQALVQEYIQRGTLLDKTSVVQASYKTEKKRTSLFSGS